MLEDELRALGERIAPTPRDGLPERVLAGLDDRPSSPPRRAWVGAAVVALVAALGLSPHVRAFAAELLDVAGIVVSDDEPDASPEPQQPLPRTKASDLERAVREADFPLVVPASLGEPEDVRVADGGRVVSLSWRDGEVVLDQFAGELGPVFEKQVGGLEVSRVELAGVPGWWIPGPHDLVYVDRRGEVVSATARLAGRTLIWERGGVTYRLEGSDLTRREAVLTARSVAGTS